MQRSIEWWGCWIWGVYCACRYPRVGDMGVMPYATSAISMVAFARLKSDTGMGFPNK
jgi:hypothetical protein